MRGKSLSSWKEKEFHSNPSNWIRLSSSIKHRLTSLKEKKKRIKSNFLLLFFIFFIQNLISIFKISKNEEIFFMNVKKNYEAVFCNFYSWLNLLRFIEAENEVLRHMINFSNCASNLEYSFYLIPYLVSAQPQQHSAMPNYAGIQPLSA